MTSPRILSFCALLVYASLASAEEKRPTTAPACEVKVTSVKVDLVTLRPKPSGPVEGEDSKVFDGLQAEAAAASQDDRQTDEKMLIVEIEVQNVSQQKFVYRTLNGTDPKCKTFATLVDNARKVYALANFGDFSVVGAVKRGRTLAPGQKVKDVLVYELPPKTVKTLKLWLPEKNLGADAKLEPVPLPTEALQLAGS